MRTKLLNIIESMETNIESTMSNLNDECEEANASDNQLMYNIIYLISQIRDICSEYRPTDNDSSCLKKLNRIENIVSNIRGKMRCFSPSIRNRIVQLLRFLMQ